MAIEVRPDDLTKKVRGFLHSIGLTKTALIAGDYAIRREDGQTWLDVSILATNLSTADPVEPAPARGWVGIMNDIESAVQEVMGAGVEVGMSWPGHVVHDRALTDADREEAKRLANNWTITIKPRAR